MSIFWLIYGLFGLFQPSEFVTDFFYFYPENPVKINTTQFEVLGHN